MTRRPASLTFSQRWSSHIFRAPFFLLVTVGFGTLALVASLWAKTGQTQHRIARMWARAGVFISGARLTVRGDENLRKYGVAVYAANHTSYMDTPVIFSALPFQFRILARKGLWSIPFIGWYLSRSGQIPIETGNARASLASLSAGVKALRAGMSLFVFPEGSRTPDGDLKIFLAGAAFLAIRAQVPLVPIALSGVYDLLPIHTQHFYPCSVTLMAGEPIETAGMTARQTEELTERLKDAIAGMLESSAGVAD